LDPVHFAADAAANGIAQAPASSASDAKRFIIELNP
jgi:hypothetical protein